MYGLANIIKMAMHDGIFKQSETLGLERQQLLHKL